MMTAERLASILRPILDSTAPIATDIEDEILALEAAERLEGEGYDRRRVHTLALTLAAAIRSSEHVAATVAQSDEIGALAGDELLALQEAFL